jgi:hypothetical protein
MTLGLKPRFDFRRWGSQNEFPFQFAAIFLDVFFFLDGRPHRFGRHRTVRAGRPRLGIRNQREGTRRNHLQGEALVRPTFAKRPPRLEVHIRKLPFFHFAGGPFGGLLDVRRIREARAINIGEVTHDFHHLGMAEAFVLVNRGEIGRGRRLRTERGHAHERQYRRHHQANH